MTKAEDTAEALAHWQADRSVALPNETIGEVLRRHARRIGERPAVYHITDAATDALAIITYGELLELAENCARALAARCAPGERIALW